MIRPFGLSEEEIKKFLRYCIVGTSNTLVDFITFVILFYLLHVDTYISQAAAFLVATFNSYIWNRRFTFKSRAKLFGKNLILFYILNFITLSISLIGLYLFYDVLGINELVSKVLAAPFVFIVNYLGNRLVIFKDQNENILKKIKERRKQRSQKENDAS